MVAMFVLILIFLVRCFPAANSAAAAGTPIFLACGSEGGGGSGMYERKWISDSTYISTSINKTISARQLHPPGETVSFPAHMLPYSSARIFMDATTYAFPIEPQTRHILKLWFVPSPFPSHNVSMSVFSVVAGGLTLLYDFSPYALIAKEYAMHEYVLAPSNVNHLNVTFIPSTSHNGSFAYINGIEVIPSPELFDSQTQVAGLSTELGLLDARKTNLESMFRLNVGGEHIPPLSDSAGLLRTWYPDVPYLVGPIDGFTSKSRIAPRYENLSAAVAPLSLYNTSRSLNDRYSLINLNDNLTWMFYVDNRFMYLLRLHFCEFNMKRVNERVFDIFLNDKIVAESVDLVQWSGSMGTPVKRDYMIYINEGIGSGSGELRVTLKPNVKSMPEFADVLLNGLEIFKVSDGQSSFAGSDVLIRKTKKEVDSKRETTCGASSKRGVNFMVVLISVVCTLVAIGLLAGILFIACMCRNRVARQKAGHRPRMSTEVRGGMKANVTDGFKFEYFPISKIKEATMNFSSALVIAEDIYGKVYKGIIDKDTFVAIRRSDRLSTGEARQLKSKVPALLSLRHRDLIPLIGYGIEEEEVFLVFEYMGEGALRQHLYGGSKLPLPWRKRIEICIAAARALHYLHTGSMRDIVHGDVTSKNILLDQHLRAKVYYSGFPERVEEDQQRAKKWVEEHSGYISPECHQQLTFTEQSDIYSFGALLLEILCGRPTLDLTRRRPEQHLVTYAKECRTGNSFLDIVDEGLRGHCNSTGFQSLTEVVFKCLDEDAAARPSMSDVLHSLNKAFPTEASTILMNPGDFSLVRDPEGTLAR